MGRGLDAAGLPRHTRSLLTIGLMVALNRGEELNLHIRAGKNNGVTAEEIREVLLQCGGVLRDTCRELGIFLAAREVLKEGEGPE